MDIQNLSLKELEEIRLRGIQQVKNSFRLCQYIIDKRGQQIVENGYCTWVWSDLFEVEIKVVKIKTVWLRREQTYMETRRLVVTYAGETAVNVLIQFIRNDQEIIDEPDWSRAIPGKWISVVNRVYQEITEQETIAQAERDEIRRKSLINILNKEV